jgi:hypothetical protein
MWEGVLVLKIANMLIMVNVNTISFFKLFVIVNYAKNGIIRKYIKIFG